MKHTKHKNLLLVGLSLILSLVAFTSAVSHLPSQAVKTALVVSDTTEDTRFSIQYHKANTITIGSFLNYTTFAFIEFQKDYKLKQSTALISYTHQTLGLRAVQLHTMLYTCSTHQTLYSDIVS
ncbi:hypothetical protein [Winogradskyella sp. R77965]|uniref:hypothetical protein n=1 Tax=Winogradskyella sp. R77965 TaxID=3093872 RepID=UPI0037DD7354